VKKLLKKYFIPHEENDHHPHILREASLLGFLVVILALFGVAVGSHILINRSDMPALVLPKVLVDYANQDRIPSNEGSLTINPLLQQAAQLKANDMATKGYFAHKTPEGYSPWYWLDKVGYDFSYAGENLAVNFSDSIDVNQAWMNSPGHRANILNGNFTEIGIATADGMYQGRQTTFVVEFFGTPAKNTEPLSIVNNTPIVKPVASTTIAGAHAKTTVSTSTKPVITAIASSSVLGASGENDLFVAVEKNSATSSSNSPVQYSTTLQRALFSLPARMLSIAYLIIATVILLGLIFLISFEVRKQHILYIVFAASLLVWIVILLYAYHTILFGPLLIK